MQLLINATGPLSQPVMPPFEGRDRFQSKTFHTNDWDHACDYRHKRVAIVGSGATDGVISDPVTGRNGTRLHDVWAQHWHRSPLGVIHHRITDVLHPGLHPPPEPAAPAQHRSAACGRTALHRNDPPGNARTIWKSGACHSWYQSKSGHVVAMFPGFSFTYHYLTRRLRLADHILS